MVSLVSLWLPIVIAAVLVLPMSFVVHMIPHRRDVRRAVAGLSGVEEI